MGYRVLDTTALAEGQHTIAWVVVDSQGAANGIGSRYFSVANSADAQAGLVASPSVTSTASEGGAVETAEPAPPIRIVAGPRVAGTPPAWRPHQRREPVLVQRGEGPVRATRQRARRARARWR